MCDNKATLILIDGDGPDDYTLACAKHAETMRSDTHVATVPFTGDAPCCALAPSVQNEIAERPMLTDDHALDGFAFAIYAAVHGMDTPEAYTALMARPEAHRKYIKAARGALAFCRLLTDYRAEAQEG